MSYTAFISYNTAPEEQVFVYRLQTLAAASDIIVLLPQRNGQRITNETKLRIDKADSVIVFLTSKLSPEVREELAYAEAKSKLIIPIYGKGVRHPAGAKDLHWIFFDPALQTPGEIEQEVLKSLGSAKKQKENREAIVLVGLGLGLLWLISSNK
ncbi:MAG: toll/interleukin-1 receptor domain-containing protein [Ignavibacteriae bacterium]|nr:toll/interleukin-1 receptor domain-containing protein [Ignavibacteria bacterium]MBI3363809.1 toll/interleukin-1 receptor domain-containing protein [Ignavibacteriota bacterium]